MDFMKLLKSLEELLYELVSWLVFYPITMWRTVTRPLEMMRYADLELSDRPEDQYDDTLSPPLFLLLTLLIAQGLSHAFPSIIDQSHPLASTANLLLGRGVIYGAFPLMMAMALIRRKAVRVTRNSLRPPFYSQCYVAAPFAFTVGLAADLAVLPDGKGVVWAVVVFLCAALWYATIEIRWFKRDLRLGTARAVGMVVLAFIEALAAALLLALVVGFSFKSLTA